MPSELPPEAAQRALEYTRMDRYQLARRAFIAERTIERLRETYSGTMWWRTLSVIDSLHHDAIEEWGVLPPRPRIDLNAADAPRSEYD